MPLKFDGDWSEAAPNGAPVLVHDIPELPEEATSIAVPMLCPFSVYSVPTAGASTSFAGETWYFSGDSGFSSPGGGVWSFTRSWVKKPSSFSNYEVFAAVYPGLVFDRDPVLISATSKVDVDFFLILPSGGDHTTAGEIPITQEDRVDYNTGYTAPLLSSVRLYDGTGLLTTTPSAASYQALIATDESTLSSYSLQVEPSVLYRVKGPLWRRENRKVKAK